MHVTANYHLDLLGYLFFILTSLQLSNINWRSAKSIADRRPRSTYVGLLYSIIFLRMVHSFFENIGNFRFRKWKYLTTTKTFHGIASSAPTFPIVIPVPQCAARAGVTEHSPDQFHPILPCCPHNTHNCQSLVSVQLSPHFRILGLQLYCLVVTPTFLLLHPLTWHDLVHGRKFDIWLFIKPSFVNGPVSLLITARWQTRARRMPKWVIYAKNSGPSWGNKQCWHPAAPNIQQVDIEYQAGWIIHLKHKYL